MGKQTQIELKQFYVKKPVLSFFRSFVRKVAVRYVDCHQI